MLRIHQISCGSMAPFGGRLVDGFSHGLKAKLICHCWLIETSEGLVLVDTGIGRDFQWDPLFKKLLKPQVANQKTALTHILKMGFEAKDVKHIVLTCLDFDHIGGIGDFPEAQIHVAKAEYDAALQSLGWLAKKRYPKKVIEAISNWQTYSVAEQDWFGFKGIRLRGLPPEILMVPLPGHSSGHSGVAVKTRLGWMLHAGDSYFYRREVDPDGYHCTIGLRIYQRLVETNHKLRVATQKKLRALVKDHSSEVRICSTHDFIELTAYQASAEPIRALKMQASSGVQEQHLY